MDSTTSDGNKMSATISTDLLNRLGVKGRSRGLGHLAGSLSRNDKGGVKPQLSNVLMILTHDPGVEDLLGYNEFSSEHLLKKPAPGIEDTSEPMPGPYPRPWGVEDIALVQSYLQRVWCDKISLQMTEQAMLTVARQNRFHPVRDWLDSLKWDGKQRIDTWMCKAFGTPDDDYHRSISAKILIASVRRVRHPGVKFDNMPVLEGEQGIGKSRAVEVLYSREWYSDDMPQDLSNKDAPMSLLSVWCLELGEIDHLIRNEVETIKAFLSRSVDRYRPPYGKSFIERPRQGVLIGTTNSTDYLRDTTGNRRIWPVRCEYSDVEWIAYNRMQLWAEACARESSGEVIWLDDVDVQKTATQKQQDRMQEDVWDDAIELWLHGKLETKSGAILSECLNIPKAQQDKRAQMRVGGVLSSLGWKRHVQRGSNGKVERVWRK